MIPCTLNWIARMNKEYGIEPLKVLDVGSYDSNGNPRSLFPGGEYTGIDIKEGANVDIVMSAYNLRAEFQEGEFDAVLCLHLLEHISNIANVLIEIFEVLKPGGYFYVSMPTIGFPYHSPPDYWRPSEEAMREYIMEGYFILDLEHGKSQFGKHPVISCLGVKG